MGLRQRNPRSAGQRFALLTDFAEITRSRPEPSLVGPRVSTGGRNNLGRITSRHRGGGVKRQYRAVDFLRDKDGVPARVAAIEYDPNRRARLALLHYADGEKRYILHPVDLKVGDAVLSGPQAQIRPGHALNLSDIPTGTIVHNVELEPGAGGKMGRSAGAQLVLSAREGDHATLTLPSGEVRKVHVRCRATVGQVGNTDWSRVNIGKAGRNRWRGIRPQSRGSAMNPVSHPMGGGEGRRAGGRHPVSPWGKPAKGGKTRGKRKVSNRFILRRRRK